MCRLCEIGEILESANSDEDAFGMLEDMTHNDVQDLISRDDVYHFLLRKYRDHVILNMDENRFKDIKHHMEEAGESEPSVPGEEKLRMLLNTDKSIH